jgi:ubiquinone/menaquinone biosynthesis C-methylase UbiE
MNATDERYVPAAGRAWLTGSYDRGIALTMREPRWRPHLVNAIAADLPHGGRAVEIGCGTGSLTLALAGARPDAHVTGVDGDPQILALAARKPGADRVTWHEGLAQELPFDDASIDVAVVSLVLHHLTDPVKHDALAEIARVLKPEGRLHVADWGQPRGVATAIGARTLQLFDGAAGPESLLAGDLPRFLRRAGLDARRHGSLPTVWGTLELWSATKD